MNELGTMKAVQLDAPGPPQALHLRDLPMPQPGEGWVRIRVEAFGLNRSELHLRLGLAEGVTFPACRASNAPASWMPLRAPRSAPASKWSR